MPLPFQIASWALDGISYIATEKSVTDHGISIIAQKDCALLRVVQAMISAALMMIVEQLLLPKLEMQIVPMKQS